jgi:mannitol-specific phosphotransferase system IIBC component
MSVSARAGGLSDAGISTVPSPPGAVVAGPGDGAGVGATVVVTVVSAVVVSDVVGVVVVVVSSSSAESLSHAVNNVATAMPEARANRVNFDAPREVIKPRLTRGWGG